MIYTATSLTSDIMFYSLKKNKILVIKLIIVYDLSVLAIVTTASTLLYLLGDFELQIVIHFVYR